MANRARTDVGELTERLTILTPVEDSNAPGGQAWPALATVWGSMVALSATERLQAQAIGSQVSYRATIYYRADVTPTMRMSWRPYLYATDKILEIHSVLLDQVEPRRFLVLDLGEVL